MDTTDIKIKFVEDKLDEYTDIFDRPLEPYTHYIYRTEINDIYHLYITLDDMRMSPEYIQDKIDLVCSLQPSNYKEFRLLLGDFDLYHCNYYEKMLRLDKTDNGYQIDHYIDEVWKDIGAYYYDRCRFIEQYEHTTFRNPRDTSIRYSKTYYATFFPFYKENELEERNFKYYCSDDKSVNIVFFDTDEDQENSTLGFIFFTDMINKGRIVGHIDLKDFIDDNAHYIFPSANNITPYPIPYKIEKEKYQFKEFSSYNDVQDARARGEVNKGDFIRIGSRYGTIDTICVSVFDNIAILSGITQDDNYLLTLYLRENFNDIKFKIKEK